MYNTTESTLPPNTTNGWSDAIGTLEQWIAEQPALIAGKKKLDEDSMLTRASGLKVHEGTDGTTHIHVPKGQRVALFKHQHKTI